MYKKVQQSLNEVHYSNYIIVIKMFSPSLEEVKKLQNKNIKRIPVTYELYSDMATPIEVLRILKKSSKHCYIFEVLKIQKWGRSDF